MLDFKKIEKILDEGKYSVQMEYVYDYLLKKGTKEELREVLTDIVENDENVIEKDDYAIRITTQKEEIIYIIAE